MAFSPAAYASIIDVPRRAWDPTEGRHWQSGSRPHHMITGVEVHWVGTGAVGDHGDSDTELHSFERFHEQSKGWTDLFYNVGLDTEGNTYEGRDITVRSQSDLTQWLTLLCVLGEGDSPSKQDYDNIHLGIWRVWGAVDPLRRPATLRRHNDRSSSACPGGALSAIVDRLHLHDLPKGPLVPLHPDAQKARDLGLWNGADPTGTATREEAAIIAYRAYSKAVADAETGGLAAGTELTVTVKSVK